MFSALAIQGEKIVVVALIVIVALVLVEFHDRTIGTGKQHD